MRYLSFTLSMVSLASVFAVSTALVQGAAGARPLPGTTTGNWSMEVVTDDLSCPWNISRVGKPRNGER